MKCTECATELPPDAQQCPACGAAPPNAPPEPVDWFPIDWIPGGAAATRSGPSRVSEGVHRIGGEVAAASRSMSNHVRAAARTPAKALRGAKEFAEREGARGKSTVRLARSKGRTIGRDVVRAGRRAEGRIRSATHRVLKRTSGGPK